MEIYTCLNEYLYDTTYIQSVSQSCTLTETAQDYLDTLSLSFLFITIIFTFYFIFYLLLILKEVIKMQGEYKKLDYNIISLLLLQ